MCNGHLQHLINTFCYQMNTWQDTQIILKPLNNVAWKEYDANKFSYIFVAVSTIVRISSPTTIKGI